MKDFFDLWVLAKFTDLDGRVLSQAVAATFERRRTGFPVDLPIGLSDEFAGDKQKVKQWQAFMRKNAIGPKPLAEVIEDLRSFLLPVLTAASKSSAFKSNWKAGEDWR